MKLHNAKSDQREEEPKSKEAIHDKYPDKSKTIGPPTEIQPRLHIGVHKHGKGKSEKEIR